MVSHRGSAAVRRWVIPLLILIATGALFYVGIRRRADSGKGQVFLELKPVQLTGGWGYLIYVNHHVYIDQTIIPAIPGAHPFRTREDALAVGKIVYDRLATGQTPMVTAAEVRAMKIYPDTLKDK